MKHKKLKTCIAFLLLSLGGLQAQEAVLTSGGEATGNGGTVSYSIGQVTYTAVGTNGSVTQGVQQVYEITTVLGMEFTNITLEVSIYPNPTTDYLNLKVENEKGESLSYQLFDMNGRLVDTQKLIGNATTINMEAFQTSTYLLKVTNDQTTIKTFRIIKN